MAFLEAAWRIRGVVRKKRFLYLTGNIRVHLGEVEGLGTFVELELVMKSDESKEQGRMVAADVMEKLGLDSADLIDVAYLDLLQARRA